MNLKQRDRGKDAEESCKIWYSKPLFLLSAKMQDSFLMVAKKLALLKIVFWKAFHIMSLKFP